MTNKKVILFSAVFIVVLLVFFEGLSRTALSVDPIVNKVRGDDDASWRLDWIKRHNDGIEIYYKFDIYDPTKGWISRPNLRNVTISGNKFLSTNSKGLRGQTDYSYDRHLGKTRILILGDSFTFGDEVSDNETYSYYLQQMIPDAEIINMGVHGYGHDQMLILLKEEGLKYKPDIVILGFDYIDIFRNGMKFKDFAKPGFTVREEKLRLINSPVPSPEVVLGGEWARLKMVDLWTMVSHRIMERYGFYDRKMRKLTKYILDEMVESIKSVSATPVFVYLPVGNEIYSAKDVAWGEAYLSEYCKANGNVECFSLRPHFIEKIKQHPELWREGEGHWTPLGHFTVAEGIRDYLTGKGYVQASSK